MDEYMNISWRENLLEDSKNFFSEADYEKSHMNQYLIGNLDPTSIKQEISWYNKKCKIKRSYSGATYYSYDKIGQKYSQFNSVEHLRLINALKILDSGKMKLNKFELGDKDLYHNSQQKILSENSLYLKAAEKDWETSYTKGTRMNNELFQYAFAERMEKVKAILNMPQYYVPVDLFPWAYNDSNGSIEMLHIANVIDIGIVSKYSPPLLEEVFTFKLEWLPPLKPNNYNSKLPISCDKNIEEYFATGAADVAISISALKKLFNYTETNQLWTMPVVIKNVTLPNGKIKKVIFFDKPLLKQTISKVDLNERCHKLLTRSNFCRIEGFRFPYQDKPIDGAIHNDEGENGIHHNVAYKLWTLQQETDEHSHMRKNRCTKSFKVLVRAKVDACTPTENILQGITVVPKLEYQLKYGAGACTKRELIGQWVDLYFRPRSVLQRVRTHYLTSEVVKIDTANISRVNIEAMQHGVKPDFGIAVFYQLLLGMEQHNEGSYLFRHELKHANSVALLKQTTDKLALHLFDLHKEYNTQCNIVDPFHKPWCPIDCKVLLPTFERNGHFPGLFKPSPVKPKVSYTAKKGGPKNGNTGPKKKTCSTAVQ